MESRRTRAQEPQATFRDGLGTRYRRDGADGPLEVLLLHDRLTTAPRFEFLVRERANRLAYLRHDSYARVHDVEPGADSTPRLALLSDAVPGIRLSRILAVAEQNLLPFDIDSALCLIRQLVAACALQHDAAPDVCHGALAPERIIVTPEGRLVVVEHVLGAALEQLGYTPERYWKDLRIALPMTGGPSCLNRRSDVVQVGAIALAILLGRPLGAHEYPACIAALVRGTFDLGGDFEPLQEWLQSWLSQALWLDPMHSFATAIDARQSLEGGIKRSTHTASRDALAAFLKMFGDVESGSPLVPPGEPDDADDAVPMLIPRSAPVATPPSVESASLDAGRRPVATAEVATAPQAVPPAPEPLAQDADPPKQVPRPIRITVDRRMRLMAAGILLVALTSGGAMAARYLVSPSEPVSLTGRLVVDTNPSGATVVIDGEPHGVTPVSVTLKPGAHVLVLLVESAHRTIPVTIHANAQLSQFIELPRAASGSGELQVRTDPAGAQVLVDGELRGVSPLIIEGLAPGTHNVTLETESGSVREDVTIEDGASASLVVPLKAPAGAPPSGWISITAPAELEVFENQHVIGSSRSDRIMVTSGRHDVELANETLGYRSRETIQVSPGQVARITPQWPQGTIAINATPWANVWLDGQELGETPVGSTPVPIGTHEVVFRHPQLGEQRYTATVTATAPARLSIDMRKK